MNEVLIKGMEMPKGCCDCNNFVRFAWNDKGQIMACYATHKKITVTEWRKVKGYEVEEFLNNRPDWCPLVEISTPHGDLIDRDALIEAMRQIIGEQASYEAWALLDTARKQPTIIEAEGSEE